MSEGVALPIATMRTSILPAFAALCVLCFVAGPASAARPWDQVPGLRAFIEGKPMTVVLPADKGGAMVPVALNQKPPGQLPFEALGEARWEMARVDLIEEARRHTFRIYSLLGASTPVRAILANGDWVDEFDIKLGPSMGAAVEADYGRIISRYELRGTQYDGLLCLTADDGERWLMRIDASQTGPRFALWTFFDTRLEFVLGASPAERGEVFRRRTLGELHMFLLPNVDGVIDFTNFGQMIEIGEVIHAADLRAWRKSFAATLQEQLQDISASWGKHRPKRVADLHKLAARLAAMSGDQPLSTADFEQAWNGSLSLAGAEIKRTPATTTAPSAVSPKGPAPAVETPSANHPLEKQYWEAFRKSAIPGLSVAQARPFARALAAGPEQSALLSYLIEAMLAAQRPDQSPYFGSEADARIGKLLAPLRALEKPAPGAGEVVAALTAFDGFVMTHTASLNLDRAAQELLAAPVAAMHAAQHVRGPGRSADFVERWRAPLARILDRHAHAARKQNRHASAAGLFLYAHWMMASPGAPLEPARYTDSSWSGTISALHAARKHAAWAAWFYFWPAMDPGASETRDIIGVINRDPVLARTNFVNVLGFTPGDAATFGAKYRSEAGMEQTPFHVVAGNPPAFLRSNDPKAAAPVVWSVPEPPDVLQARKKMLEARQTLQKEIDRYRESRRFWALDDARARLAEFDGTAPAPGSTPQTGAAQRGLDEARAAYQKDLRDGVYVGRSLERADTIYTRPLSSMERRSREFEIEIMERQLADQQREAQRQQSIAEAEAKYRDQLTDDIFEKEKRVDTRGHLAKVAELKESVRYYEARYADVLKKQGKQGAESGVTAESIARAQLVRTRLKEGTLARYKELEKRAVASQTVDDAMETHWFAWFFDFPEIRENVGREVFYGTAEAEEQGKDEEARGKPLAEFAEVLLEPLSPKGPTKLVSGLQMSLAPHFPPSPAWRVNQIDGLLNDAWFRFSHDPYALRGQVFKVVKALRAAIGEDSATVEALKPWVRRFRALAPAETQSVVLQWKDEPSATLLLVRAGG